MTDREPDSSPILSPPDSDLTGTLHGGERDPLDHLAEEFVERCRRGENPSIAEYEARHPDRAEQVRKLLGAVAMMEQLRRGSKQARFMPERIGEYRILRELGRGGMGVVYEAVQESLWRHVAIKAIHHTQLDLKRLQRFGREAQAVAQLHHTNIVPIFGVGDHEGIPYYAMQYIRGRGLDALLDAWRRDGLLPPADRWRLAARLAAQAAGALDYAHGQGILHRDIKPANLLIDEHEAVWITDFGLAKMVGHDELTASGDVIGTLRYLAPESLRGISEARSDVYSLGLTLYEMVTLRPPYGDLTPSELLHRVSEGQPARPRQVDPAIPRDLETIILKATARDLQARYATAGALADDLQCFLNDRPIAARRASFVERGYRWSRRNRGTATLMVLAALSLAAAAVAGWSGYAFKTMALESESARREVERNRAIQVEGLFQEFTGFVLNTLESVFPAEAESGIEEDIPLTQALMASQQSGAPRMFADHLEPPGSAFDGGPPGRRGRPDDGSGPGFGFGPGFGRGRPGDRGPAGWGRGQPRRPDDFGDGPRPPGGPASGSVDPNLAMLKRLMAAYDRFAETYAYRGDPKLQKEAAWIYFKLGVLSERSGDRAAADRAFDQAVDLFEKLATSHASEPAYFERLPEIFGPIIPWQTDPGMRTEVETRLDRLATLVGRLLAAAPDDLGYLRARMRLLGKLGLIRYQQRHDGVEESFREAIELAGILVDRLPEDGHPHSDRADVLEAYALVLEDQRRGDEARRQLEAAFEDLEWVAADGLKSEAVATRMESLADDFERLGDQARSDAIQRRADEIDPREPLPGRPKPGRPFGSRRSNPGPPRGTAPPL